MSKLSRETPGPELKVNLEGLEWEPGLISGAQQVWCVHSTPGPLKKVTPQGDYLREKKEQTQQGAYTEYPEAQNWTGQV